MTTSPDWPQAMPMLYGWRAHQERMRSASVVARSCQFSRSAGRFAPGAHGNTCHPRSAAASADHRGPGSARPAPATLTPDVIPSNRYLVTGVLRHTNLLDIIEHITIDVHRSVPIRSDE